MPLVTIIAPTAKASDNVTEAAEKTRRKVAGYARVSTDRDEQFTSYEAQVEYYTRFIKSHGEWDFVGVYTDEGITGTSMKHRTGFRAMVRDALDGKIDLIVTKSVSRFARNTVDSLTTIRKLKEHGTEVYFEKENIWTFDGKGELLITIMSSLAQEESRSISENVTWGMREAMRRGKASVPYKVFLGYDKGPDGNMIINPEQAMTVRRIYGMFLQGMSPYRISRELESEGIEFSEGRTKWYSTTVMSILQNEKYRGDALRQKTYVKNFLTKETVKNKGELQQYYIHDHHEAIISPELFDRVQLEIKTRGTAEKLQGGSHPLSKRVKCGDCGAWYGLIPWAPNTKYEKYVWRCNRMYSKEKENCKCPAMTEDVLKEKYLAALSVLISDPSFPNSFEHVNDDRFRTEGLDAERGELVRELETVGGALKDAENGGQENGENNENVEETERLERRAALASKRIEKLDGEILRKNGEKEELAGFIRGLAGNPIADSFDENIWDCLVDHMTVYSRENVTVTFKDGTEIRV